MVAKDHGIFSTRVDIESTSGCMYISVKSERTAAGLAYPRCSSGFPGMRWVFGPSGGTGGDKVYPLKGRMGPFRRAGCGVGSGDVFATFLSGHAC